MYEVIYRTKIVPRKIKLDARALYYLIKCNTLFTFVLINLYDQVASFAKLAVFRYIRQGYQTPLLSFRNLRMKI